MKSAVEGGGIGGGGHGGHPPSGVSGAHALTFLLQGGAHIFSADLGEYGRVVHHTSPDLDPAGVFSLLPTSGLGVGWRIEEYRAGRGQDGGHGGDGRRAGEGRKKKRKKKKKNKKGRLLETLLQHGVLCSQLGYKHGTRRRFQGAPN